MPELLRVLTNLIERRVSSVVYSPCGTKIASASADKTLRIWNAQTGQCVSTLSVDYAVISVAFSPDGSKIAAANWNEIQIFDTQTQAKLGSPLSGHSDW